MRARQQWAIRDVGLQEDTIQAIERLFTNQLWIEVKAMRFRKTFAEFYAFDYNRTKGWRAKWAFSVKQREDLKYGCCNSNLVKNTIHSSCICLTEP